MPHTRRRFLHTLAGAAATSGSLGFPPVSRAQPKKLTVWWNRGYYKEEDEAILKIAEEFRKSKNVDLDLALTPQAELVARLHQAFAAGHGPDVVFCISNDWEIVPRYAWYGKLVETTDLPMADVALASGFRSLRRFNDAFAQRYRMSPTRLRRAAVQPAESLREDAGMLELRLGWRPPYDIEGLLRFFARRAMPGVEAVEQAPPRLRRSVRAGVLAPAAGWIEATWLPERAQLHLRLPAEWSNDVLIVYFTFDYALRS